jgi:hypothetical protein
VTAPSLLILGADAVLAAKPATPVQLAHACLAAGFHAAIPATWGDELVAARVLDKLRDAQGPCVQCCCPLVMHRLASHAESITGMLLTVIAPPVATARYLRALYAPTRIRLTFAGSCPSATDDSIDESMTPERFFRALAEQGIVVTQQPTEFDSILPPDRRRFHSEPGGVPTRAALGTLPTPVEFHELRGPDFITELAQHLLSTSRLLLDVAPALGCACSGVLTRVRPEMARDRVRELEPPRAMAPVVDHALSVSLEASLQDTLESPRTVEGEALSRSIGNAPAAPASVEPTANPAVASEPGLEPSLVAVEASPRRSPVGTSRPVLGLTPNTRIETGRQLPRAYVARRRSSPRGVRATAARGADPTALASTRRTRLIALILAGGLAGGLALGWLLSALL